MLGLRWEWGSDIDPGESRGGFRFFIGDRHVQSSPASSIEKYGWDETLSSLADYVARIKGVPIGWNNTIPAGMAKPEAAAVIEEEAFREQS